MNVARYFVVFALTLAHLLQADTLRLTSGRDMDCVVIGETSEHYTVRRGYGVMDIPKSIVVDWKKPPPVKANAPKPSTQPASAVTSGSAGRFPTWSAVVDTVIKQPWGRDLQQIPATYIDNGVQKDVPYQSYACGGDYEVNIYGDPDNPACIEIGIYRSLLTNETAKASAIDLMASLLPNKIDASILKLLNREKDLITRDEFTIEITPPNAPDAYGGWWVSLYDESKLDNARASPAEIEALTVATAPTAPPTRTSTKGPEAKQPPKAPPPAVKTITGDDSDNDWTPDEIARRKVRSTAAVSSAGGRVYVRGYYRRDGTYVSPHSRRR